MQGLTENKILLMQKKKKKFHTIIYKKIELSTLEYKGRIIHFKMSFLKEKENILV